MTNPFDLTGHCSLVTGGNSGIGLGMAEGLVQAGADVAIWGTNIAKNERAQERLNSLGGGRAVALRCDVGEEEQIASAFADYLDELGHARGAKRPG